jgi:hypothetical protein
LNLRVGLILLIETQFKRTGNAVVATDLGAAMASPEGRATGRPMPASAFESQSLTTARDYLAGARDWASSLVASVSF